MLNSVFRKWLLATAFISLAILFFMSASVSWLVQRDFYRQGLARLNDRSSTVEAAYAQWSADELTTADFRKELKRIEQENNVNISVAGGGVNYLKQDLYEVGVRPDVKRWIKTVTAGGRIEKIARFSEQDEEKMLIIGFPLQQADRKVAAAFIYSPAADAKALAAPIRRSIWLIALACAGPLVLLLWLATRRFVGPIRRMSEAAVSIAGGDFKSRVSVGGNDELARLGASFNAMAARMERVEEQRRRLIMEIAHELRTPLTSIRGTLQAMQDGILSDKEQTEFVALSLDESARLGSLIDSLHELSAFEEHRIRFERKAVDLTELVRQSVQQLQPKADEAGMRLYADTDAGVYLQGDPMRLRQVMLNIVGNALTHNPAGTSIAVRLRTAAHRAVITVRDDGRGIAREHLPHLFERLYKAESSRTSRGSGLGLTIARHIVQAHGGTIEASSEAGQGSEFKVTLPLSRTDRVTGDA